MIGFVEIQIALVDKDKSEIIGLPSEKVKGRAVVRKTDIESVHECLSEENTGDIFGSTVVMKSGDSYWTSESFDELIKRVLPQP